jgi:hypothetical protein
LGDIPGTVQALGERLPFDSVDALRAAKWRRCPRLVLRVGSPIMAGANRRFRRTVNGEIADYPIKDFYLTNAICRASPKRCRNALRPSWCMERRLLEAAE